MLITSQPVANTLYFQKAVPDIAINQASAATSVLFVLKTGGVTILAETYTYNFQGGIIIRELYKICEKYLVDGVQYKEFECTLSEDYTEVFNFAVLKCEAENAATANAWCAANFLTRSFREKRTAAECNETLSYLQLAAQGVITPHYEILYMLNGVLTTATGTLATIAAKTVPTVVSINTSCTAIRTAANIAANVEILNYKIWLTATGVDTNRYCYMVDNNAYRVRNYFVFENCFGVAESVRFTGNVEKGTSNEFTYGNIQNMIRLTGQNFTVENNCFTGYLTDREMEWLNDFVISPAILTYKPYRSETKSIVLTTIDKNNTSANVLAAFAFGYKAAKTNHLQFENAVNGLFDYTFNNTFN